MPRKWKTRMSDDGAIKLVCDPPWGDSWNNEPIQINFHGGDAEQLAAILIKALQAIPQRRVEVDDV